jgi:hypothetical protein
LEKSLNFRPFDKRKKGKFWRHAGFMKKFNLHVFSLRQNVKGNVDITCQGVNIFFSSLTEGSSIAGSVDKRSSFAFFIK